MLKKSSSAGWLTPLLKMTPGFAAFSVVCGIAALIVALSESGPYDYLMKLELEIFGAGEQTMTALMTFGLLLVPLYLTICLVGKLAPSLVWAAPGVPRPEVMDRLNHPVRRVSWKGILITTAIPLLAGAVLCPWMYLSEQKDRNERLYPIDLTSGAADPVKDAKFVQVTGLIARQYALSFKRTFNTVTRSHEMFAPITGNGWTRSNPVDYFMRVESYEDGRGKVEWPAELRQSGPARFSGKVSPSLPAYVESEFRSKGLKIGPSYSVIDLNNLPNPKASRFSGWAAMTAGICLLLAVSGFVTLALAKLMLANMQRKAGAC